MSSVIASLCARNTNRSATRANSRGAYWWKARPGIPRECYSWWQKVLLAVAQKLAGAAHSAARRKMFLANAQTAQIQLTPEIRAQRAAVLMHALNLDSSNLHQDHPNHKVADQNQEESSAQSNPGPEPAKASIPQDHLSPDGKASTDFGFLGPVSLCVDALITVCAAAAITLVVAGITAYFFLG